LPGHFFDSSALVKLYHPEVGTPVVDRIVYSSNSPIKISRLTPVELTSAFAIKVRTKAIDSEDADLFLLQFRTDVATGKLEVFSIGESEFAVAESLIERYAFKFRLRALDALQLAIALELRKQKLVDHFVAADRILCEVAELEGFLVINPEASLPSAAR
jgi:predicted nucleic acid-binding protein